MGKLWGLVRNDGELVVEPRFEETFGFWTAVRWCVSTGDGVTSTRQARWSFPRGTGKRPPSRTAARLCSRTTATAGSPSIEMASPDSIQMVWRIAERGGLSVDRITGLRFVSADLMIAERSGGKYGFITPDGNVADRFPIRPRWVVLRRARAGADRRPLGLHRSRRAPGDSRPIRAGEWPRYRTHLRSAHRILQGRARGCLPGRKLALHRRQRTSGVPWSLPNGVQFWIPERRGTGVRLKACGYIDRTGRVIWPWESTASEE